MTALNGNSEIGITVGVIDAIITLAKIVNDRIDVDELICGEKGDKFQPIRDALRELQSCPAFDRIVRFGDQKAMEIIRNAADFLNKKII